MEDNLLITVVSEVSGGVKVLDFILKDVIFEDFGVGDIDKGEGFFGLASVLDVFDMKN